MLNSGQNLWLDLGLGEYLRLGARYFSVLDVIARDERPLVNIYENARLRSLVG